MFENSDTDGRSVLRSKSYLTTSHMPDRPIGRDSEIQRIADSLRPLAGREVPENLLVYGPSGAGKTTCVKHVLSKLEEETRVKTVYINCWQYSTQPDQKLGKQRWPGVVLPAVDVDRLHPGFLLQLAENVLDAGGLPRTGRTVHKQVLRHFPAC